jgi:hypothetical protein
MQRAAVNIYKTDSSYEMLVFAPGRIKENFHIDVKGNEIDSFLHTTGRFSKTKLDIERIQSWWICKNFYT